MIRIAIFAAFEWECTPVARHLREARRETLRGHTLWRGSSSRGEVWLIKTGMGPSRAQEAAEAIRDAGRFSLFLSTGCAGALSPDLETGDVVVGTALVSESEPRPFDTHVMLSDQAREIARVAGLRAHGGTVLCSPVVLPTAEDKAEAAARTGAVAVEMEGEPIARCAAQLGIPFVTARAILDDARTELLVNDDWVDPETGEVRPFRVAAHVVRHPGVLWDMNELRKLRDRTQESLALLFAGWLTGG